MIRRRFAAGNLVWSVLRWADRPARRQYRFGSCGRDFADRLEKPAVVESGGQFECRLFDLIERPPWPTSLDDFGLMGQLMVSAKALS